MSSWGREPHDFREQFGIASGQIGERTEYKRGRRWLHPPQNTFLKRKRRMDLVTCTRISRALARKPTSLCTTVDFLNGCPKQPAHRLGLCTYFEDAYAGHIQQVASPDLRHADEHRATGLAAY